MSQPFKLVTSLNDVTQEGAFYVPKQWLELSLDHRIVIRIEGAITCGFKLKAKLATS